MDNLKRLTDEEITRAVTTQSITFPMTSEITGVDEYNNVIYDRAIGSEELSEFDKEIFKDGIFSTNANYYKVTSNNNMTVTVNFGKAYIQGRKVWHKLTTTLTLTTSTTPRKDIVVLRLDRNDAVRDTILAVKENTTTLTRNSLVWELKLAEITIRPNNNQILTTDITDTRLDSAVCGFSANNFTNFDTTNFYNQLSASYTSFNTSSANQLNTQQNTFNTQLNAQKTTFDNWFAQSQDKIEPAFDFDNTANLIGSEITITLTYSDILETIRQNNVIFATRKTEFLQSSTKITTICQAKQINTVETIVFNADGTIKNTITRG